MPVIIAGTEVVKDDTYVFLPRTCTSVSRCRIPIDLVRKIQALPFTVFFLKEAIELSRPVL
jgi:hypothetical protein